MASSAPWDGLKFVTGNANKVREAREILGIDLEQATLEGAYEIQTADLVELVRHKAEQAYHALRTPVLVEDSGLVFSAWNGLPGALVKWFESSVGCAGMLKMLEGFQDRGAFAQCCVAVHDGREIVLARGEVRGAIARGLRGSGGFGWDVLFIPDGHDRTYAEMSVAEKNAISHRMRAFAALRERIG
ncbi:MAG: RdgB/HAM1 family non-canonical purine NTP pyrophosphatase [Nitrospinaceae bacterium]|jgi:non-canonical purine NTP pyrophosphatase (RdgB/HAM1 family)|nr:MAG: RdgB/HAM1 family non-canonical purine NTP pyrophosphatase [Nitrospinaceae bacterium]